MGATIGVRARSPKLQKEMLSFLEKHYRNWATIVEIDDSMNVSDPTGDADYDDGKNFVGFNYSGSYGWDRYWTTTTCRWIALQVGRRRRTFTSITPGKLEKPTPFVTYDGYEHWPVIVASGKLPKGQQWCSTNKFGLPNGPRIYLDYATTAAEGVFSDSDDRAYKAWDAFEKEASAARWGEREKAGEVTRDQVIDEKQHMMAKHFKTLMVEAFNIMQLELIRLQKLWDIQERAGRRAR